MYSRLNLQLIYLSYDLDKFYPTPHTGAAAAKAWEAMARSGILGLIEN
jgi:hypothetical protein